MKKLIFFVAAILLINMVSHSAASVKYNFNPEDPSSAVLLKKFAGMSVKQIRMQIGRKLSLKELASVKLLQWKIKNKRNRTLRIAP